LKISIITVTLNAASTVRATLESVAMQTHDNIEHIIIDGNSWDNTIAIVNEYTHVTKVISEPDNGLYDAMNKGISIATGDAIGILNADDSLYDKTTIESVTHVFNESPSLELLYGNIEYFQGSKYEKVVRYWKTKKYHPTFFEDGEAPPHPSLFVRKKVYQEIGGYNPTFKIAADYEFMLRALKVNKLKNFYLDKTLVRMRLGGISTKGVSSYLTSARELTRAWRINGYAYPLTLIPKRFFLRIQQLRTKQKH